MWVAIDLKIWIILDLLIHLGKIPSVNDLLKSIEIPGYNNALTWIQEYRNAHEIR